MMTKNVMLLAAVVLLTALPLVMYHGATAQQPNGPGTAAVTTQPGNSGATSANAAASSAQGTSQSPAQAAPTQALFGGSDVQGMEAITAIDPGYKPWFSPIWQPPSSEIESLLFALQAALGAGFVGYYFGYRRGRRQQEARSEG